MAEEDGSVVTPEEILQNETEETSAAKKDATPNSMPELEDCSTIEDDPLNDAIIEPNSTDTPLQMSDLG